jgi:hypothetical protein
MSQRVLDGDECITGAPDDPVPARCQEPDCEAVDCAPCDEVERAACVGGACVALQRPGR